MKEKGSEIGQKKGMHKKKKEEGKEMDREFFGDLVVTQSSCFIHETMIS